MGQRRYFLNDIVPQGHASLALALAPLLGHEQRTMPIRQLERRIDGSGGRQRLLGGNASAQHITVVQGIVFGEIGHELGRLLHQSAIFRDVAGAFKSGPPQQFCQINKVGLLPDEETAHARGSLNGAGVGHLHPAEAFETLSAGNLTGIGGRLEIP